MINGMEKKKIEKIILRSNKYVLIASMYKGTVAGRGKKS